MTKPIRIGTRESDLAVYQAKQVASFMSDKSLSTELVYIKSEGDINLKTPLYAFGVQGIFTKSLDIALLENRIDVAVHSYKDVPTQLAKGLKIAAVLKRANPFDVLVFRNKAAKEDFNSIGVIPKIATSSIRRKAQWLHKYKNSEIENLRGNVNTRLQKVQDSDWHGAIFAAAGLNRLGIDETQTGPQQLLDWMLPAPAQGAIVVLCRENDTNTFEVCQAMNHEPTAICTKLERDFLSLLQGGCSTPISAYATIEHGEIAFEGNVTAVDGSGSVTVKLKASISEAENMAKLACEEILNKGAKSLM